MTRIIRAMIAAVVLVGVGAGVYAEAYSHGVAAAHSYAAKQAAYDTSVDAWASMIGNPYGPSPANPR
jgi:hypothetical protein